MRAVIFIAAVAAFFGVWGIAMSFDAHDQRMLKPCHLTQQERDRVVLWMSSGK